MCLPNGERVARTDVDTSIGGIPPLPAATGRHGFMHCRFAKWKEVAVGDRIPSKGERYVAGDQKK